MGHFGNQNGQFGQIVTEKELKTHLMGVSQWLELPGYFLARNPELRQIPLHAGQKYAHLHVCVLIGIQQIAPVPENKVGDLCHQPFLIGTGDQQGCGLYHREVPLPGSKSLMKLYPATYVIEGGGVKVLHCQLLRIDRLLLN